MAILLVGACVSGPASAATETIEVRGVVPVICRADFQSAYSPRGDGSMMLGAIDEFCNASSGYRVVVDYSGTDDPGALIVDGRWVPLDPSGHTVISMMDGPRMVSERLGYRPGSHPISALHVQIETDLI